MEHSITETAMTASSVVTVALYMCLAWAGRLGTVLVSSVGFSLFYTIQFTFIFVMFFPRKRLIKSTYMSHKCSHVSQINNVVHSVAMHVAKGTNEYKKGEMEHPLSRVAGHISTSPQCRPPVLCHHGGGAHCLRWQQ